MAYEFKKFYIDGKWVDPVVPKEFKVINPATEDVAGVISMGGQKDVDLAVAAARRAFDSYSQSSRADRRALLEKILSGYTRRHAEIGDAIRDEMGAPSGLAQGAQAGIGVGHLKTMIEVLANFQFEERRGTSRLLLEPVGVCALITPWNWPINQVVIKAYPAFATGCTVVHKPSEVAPFTALRRSGRMLAALLFAVNEERLPPEAASARRELLEALRRETRK